MSVVAMSGTVGSFGDQIGRAVAAAIGYEFADRDIISTAAERFGEEPSYLNHAAEEKPTLRERLTASQRRACAYIEAVLFELASRDNVVLVGRASTILLSNAPHTLRVRAIAPEPLRVERTQRRLDLPAGPARDFVRRSDHERAARVRFVYDVDWADPLLYDLVISTERVGTQHAARVIIRMLEDDQFRSTEASRARMADMSVVAQARAALLANPLSGAERVEVACADGYVSLTGEVDCAQAWAEVETIVRPLPGVRQIRNDITVVGLGDAAPESEELSHDGFRHGEGRGWGGYGGEWYGREWQAVQRYRAARRQAAENRRHAS